MGKCPAIHLPRLSSGRNERNTGWGLVSKITATANHRPMFGSLQIVRFAASALVMLFHLGGAFAADKYFGAKTLGEALSFGHHAVILFFVLSGFLITWMHADDFDRPHRFLPYLRRRLTRILPIYWLVFTAVYVGA